MKNSENRQRNKEKINRKPLKNKTTNNQRIKKKNDKKIQKKTP